MPNLYKLLLTLTTIIGFITYDVIYTVPVENVRLYNILVEFSFSLMCAVLFMSINSLKGKSFYKSLCIGFFMVFVSMLVDGLDQFHIHGELYTAIFEKTTLLIGIVFVFIGMEAWIVDHGLMNKKLEKQAYTDELTGLFNRRGMLKKIKAMNELAEKNHQELSFIIADLDDFKIYNDTMGHIEGDKYLADMGKTLYAMMSANAVIGRWGGEEFAICMLGSNLDSAFEFSEEIRNAVAFISLPAAMKKEKMTVSLGVSQKQPQEPFMEAIKRADRSLYKAKHKGKNQSIAA